MQIKIHCLLIVLVLISCNGGNKSTDNGLQDEVSNISQVGEIEIEAVELKESVFEKQIISNGIVEATQNSQLRFKTSERIASIKVKNGQLVNSGQVLAVLDNAILENQLNKARLEFDKAKSQLQEEKINFGIADSGAIDPIVLKNLQIKSGFLEAQNTLENAQLLYQQTILRAPFKGVVANLEAKTGNYITSGDVFCNVLSQQDLQVVFSVLESDLPYIQNNQEIQINTFSNGSKTYKGNISEINPLVDENGLIQVKGKVNNPEKLLFNGMHIKVVINQPIENVIVIPKEALVLRSNKEVVFTVENGLAKWNYVEVLDENSSSYAIKKGLKLEDTVVVSGNMNLAHDARVKLNIE